MADADAAPVAPTAAGDAVGSQKKLQDALMRQDSMGGLHNGTIIEVYQSPNGDKMVEMIDAMHFNCLCCPATNTNNGARNAGPSLCNVMHHMGSKAHWTNFRRDVFDQPFDEAAWLAFTAGNQHGPARATRTAQYQSRAANSAAKSEAVQRAKRQAHLRRWRLVARVAALLAPWHARAIERAYAPGGIGFEAARAEFEGHADAEEHVEEGVRRERRWTRRRALASRSACRRAQLLPTGSTGDGAHTQGARAGERTSQGNSSFEPVGIPAGGTLSSVSNYRMMPVRHGCCMMYGFCVAPTATR